MFEHPFGNLLCGQARVKVEDPNGINPPSTIIQTEHDWQVEVAWQIKGPAAPFLGGEWYVSAYVESIGPGEEKQVSETQIAPLADAPPLPMLRTYVTTIDVSAGELSEGAYKLVVLITYKNGGVPLELAAFAVGPVIQIYDGQP